MTLDASRPIRIAALALALALVASAGAAATIQIVDKDNATEGFNDPTAAAPVGGNPGTTRGAQRLNVFNQAAAIWGAILPSAVTIKCDAYFDPLACDATGAVLGSTLPWAVARDFPGAEWPGTWYVIALANKQSGADLDLANSDMQATFNSTVDDNTCLGTVNWYYGYDHNHGSNLDLLAVVLHELGHGLGFTSLVNPSTGQYAGYNPNPTPHNPSDPHPDAFSRFLYDNTQDLYWDQLTPAQRAASALNTGNLVWRGGVAMAHAPDFLGWRQVVRFDGTGFTGEKAFGTADFGPPLSTPPISAEVVYVNDGVAPTGDGCETPFTNAGALAGKIALVDRGLCLFTQKTKDAQVNGAIAVIIANNTSGLIDPTGVDATITIPTISISQADGTALKAALAGGPISATLGVAPPALQGADVDGWPLMYAPNPLEPGSSVSHFDTSAEPDLLMEPNITPNLTSSVDLTRYVLEDEGWFLPRPLAVDGAPSLALGLEGGAPNPFRVRTSIRYSVPKSGFTEMGVYDVSGRLVKRLMNSWTPAGSGSIIWDATRDDGNRVPAGVYLYRLRIDGQIQTQRVVVTE